MAGSSPLPLPSSFTIWEEIDLSESYLVCCMFEEAASLASSIVQRISGSTEVIEVTELVDMMESTGMVFVQSLKELGRTSELMTELKVLFGSVAAIPGQVFITGACMQIKEGFSSGLSEIFEEFFGTWKYAAGESFLLPNEKTKHSSSEGSITWPLLSTDKFLEIIELYAVTFLGTVLQDPVLAISWIEKAELPDEKCQQILRRLQSLYSVKDTSSSLATGTPRPAEKVVDDAVTPPGVEGSVTTSKAQKHPNQNNPKSAMLKSIHPSPGYLFNMLDPFCWFRTIRLKCGNTTLVLHRGKIMLWCSFIVFICYVFRKKRATLQRIAARQVSSIGRALIDAWQLAFSVQVNPLAAIQPPPSVPHGSR